MPTRQLLVGHSYRTLRKEAFDRADQLASEGIGRIRWVTETDYRREQLEDAWARSRSSLRLRTSDLATVASELHEQCFGPVPEPGTEQRRRVIEQALARVDPPQGIDDPRQYVELFSELFVALEREGYLTGVPAEELTESEPYGSLLGETFEQYLELRRLLVHPESMARYGKMQAVAETEEALTDAIDPVEVVIISGLTELGAVEWSFIERLTDAVHVIVVLPQTRPEPMDIGVNRVVDDVHRGFLERGFERHEVVPTDEVTTLAAADAMYTAATTKATTAISWHEAPTPDRTVRHVARAVRTELAGGTDPEDIVVVAPGLLSYREYIADAFDTYEIDWTMHLSVFLEHTYVGRAVQDAIALSEHATGSRLVELVTNPVVTVEGVEPGRLAVVHRRLYTDDVWRLIAEVGDTQPGVDGLLDRAQSVRDASSEDFIDRVYDLLDTLGLDLDEGVVEGAYDLKMAYERGAITKVRSVLESLEEVLDRVGSDEPIRDLREALDARVSPGRQDVTGRVQIIGIEDTPMIEPAHVFVLAPTAETLPPRRQRPRFFRQLADTLDVLPRGQQRDRARYHFGLLLANAADVHLATPERTMDDDQILVSPMVDELARVANLTPTSGVAEEPIAAVEDLQRIQARTRSTVQERIEAAKETTAFTQSQHSLATQGITCASNRRLNRFTVHDAQLSDDILDVLGSTLTRQPLSPNRLSAYSRCGFKYVLDQGLEFDEPEDIEPGTDPREVGLLIHRVLQGFIGGLQSAPGERVILDRYDRAELERRLVAETLDAIDEVDFEVSTVFDERLLGVLLEGLGDRSTNPYFDHFDAGEDIDRGLFVRFLDTELADDDDRAPALVEHAFDGLSVTPPDGGRAITLRGYIDRVDIDPEGRHATVYDYKTSSEASLRATERHAVAGLDFQLPVYELAGLDIEGIESVESRYYQVRTKPQVDRLKDLGSRLEKVDIDRRTFLEVVTTRRLDAAVTALEAGAFQPTILDPDDAGCSYCGYRDVCDVRHHHRHDLRTLAEEAGSPQYVPDIAFGSDWETLAEHIDRWTDGEQHG